MGGGYDHDRGGCSLGGTPLSGLALQGGLAVFPEERGTAGGLFWGGLGCAAGGAGARGGRTQKWRWDKAGVWDWCIWCDQCLFC